MVMQYTIINSTTEDIDEIFRLYDCAVALQQQYGAVQWPQFERSLIEKEIQEQRQWKLLIGNDIACVWATTFEDPQIWEEKNADPAIYIHRIATNPLYRGRNLVAAIVDWAKAYATAKKKRFVRMDTVGENKGLIKHYRQCGFDLLGIVKLKSTKGLPAHYSHPQVCLFEMTVV